MWMVKVTKNHINGMCSRKFYRSKEDALNHVSEIVNISKLKHLTVESVGDENGDLHIYSVEDPTSFDQIVSVSEENQGFEPEIGLVSNMYRYRDSYFLDCTHDAMTGVISVYLYDRSDPENKYGVVSRKAGKYEDDQDIILSAISQIEDVIHTLEGLRNNNWNNQSEN